MTLFGLDEPVLRLAAFASVFAVMAAFELVAPWRALRADKRARWVTNLGLVVLDAVAVRVLVPATAAGVALVCEARGFGLLNVLAVPAPVAAVVAFVALDLAIWAQHVAFHKVPVLWRVHRMHHADVDLDVTSGLRFHPLEILVSSVFKIAVVALLGAPAVAVVVFEVVLNAMAQFNHANVRLPARIEPFVRLAVVTPEFHRVHHSVEPEETDSNYGFNLSVWDRVFGTYRAAPRAGLDGMTIGLAEYQDGRSAGLGWSLALPFRDPPGRAAKAARGEPAQK